MRTTLFVVSALLLACGTCCGSDSGSGQQTVLGTNSLISPGEPGRPEQSAFGLSPIRLSLDLPHSVPLAPSGELPIRSDVNLLLNVAAQERVNSIEWAEWINVEAMHRYREEWKKFLDEFAPRPVPVLYPSAVQQTLENTE